LELSCGQENEEERKGYFIFFAAKDFARFQTELISTAHRSSHSNNNNYNSNINLRASGVEAGGETASNEAIAQTNYNKHTTTHHHHPQLLWRRLRLR
jgi:hypothetical protein